MSTTNLARLTRDIRAARAVLQELGDLTPAVESSLQGWFRDVPLPNLPIAVMEMEDEERVALTQTVLTEMVEACAAAPSGSDAEAFAHLAPILDPLWKELVSLRAESFNAEFAQARNGLEEMQETLGITAEQIAEQVLSMPIDEALALADEDGQVRLVLQVLGIIS